MNSFVLTNDGKVYSWGQSNYCLGRELAQQESRITPLKKEPFGGFNHLQKVNNVVPGLVQFPLDSKQVTKGQSSSEDDDNFVPENYYNLD